ncbi:unnamed protein product, partial [Lampetra planeri]
EWGGEEGDGGGSKREMGGVEDASGRHGRGWRLKGRRSEEERRAGGRFERGGETTRKVRTGSERREHTLRGRANEDGRGTEEREARSDG